MFEGFSQRTIEFMWNIRFNNNKPWFEEHKDEYKCDFLKPMKELGGEVFERISSTYGDHGFIHKVSRIYRDARRLHGEDPYRDHLWFSIERPSEEWTATPVFWFELSPDSWRYGMGYYQAKAITMAKFRARIDKDFKRFEKLILPLSKQSEFVIDGDEYKRTKTPINSLVTADSDIAKWYNKKSFSLIHNQKNGPEIFSPELVDRLVAGYKSLMPLYDYFITLDSDPEPKSEG